jgi:hypothetical protein
MSTVPEMDIDLEKLFLPAWAQESASANRYAHFSGGGGAERPDRDRDFRPGRRPPGRDNRDRDRNRAGEKPRGFGKDRRGPAHRGEGERRERVEPQPLPEVNVTLVPDENGVESLVRQIRTTGRAYPLFGIAQVVLQKAERFSVRFAVKKSADGKPVQPLFVCALDETLWLSEDEVVAHVLSRHFATFYQAERTATEPPKGTYTFVGQCGMSGAILGPPNHHDYQNQLRKLHAEKFSRMPFDMFKARVKIVRDEAVVKKWVEDQSWKTEYVCLNVPEPLKLTNMEEVENHFRAVHKETIVKPTETHTVSGVAGRGIRCQGLARLAREVVEDQRRFPLQMATLLSQQFGSLGLQFFKVNRTVTHVSVARPSYLDLETTPVSDSIKSIIAFINSKPKCTRRQLVEALAPTPKPAVIEVQPTAAPAEAAGPTPEQTAVISDLHWLIHQGHVIEFASGVMETAKKPAPRPPKPEARPAKAPAETVQLQSVVEEAPLPAAAVVAPPEAAVEEAPAQIEHAASPAPDIAVPVSEPAAAPASTEAQA